MRTGPEITINKSCQGCECVKTESYAVQCDSGCDVYCTHPVVIKKRVGDTNWRTPDWCPVLVEQNLVAAPTLPSMQEVPTDPYAEVTLTNFKAGKLSAARIYVAYCELSEELKAANGAIERYAAQDTGVQALPDIVPWKSKCKPLDIQYWTSTALDAMEEEITKSRAQLAQLKGKK